MASIVTNLARKLLAQGNIDWDTGGTTYKCALTTSTFAPAQSMTYMTSVTNELTDVSYARVAVTTRAVDSLGNCTADNAVFPALGGAQTVAYAVVYKFVTGDADSPIVAICAVTPGAVNGTDFTIDWDGAGVVFSLAL